MNGKNLGYFVLGAAIVAVGLGALAVTIPHSFSAGDVISAGKLNENFGNLKTAVDALEGPNSVTTARLADGAVSTTKIANDAVTAPKIVNGAVTAPKIADEPGVASAFLSLGTAPVGNTANVTEVALTAPGPGTVVVQATGYVSIVGALSAVNNIVRVSLSTTSATIDNDNLVVAEIVAGARHIPYAVMFTDSVTAAGIRTYYLVTDRVDGTSTNIFASRNHLIATYYPTAYGAVASTSMTRSR